MYFATSRFRLTAHQSYPSVCRMAFLHCKMHQEVLGSSANDKSLDDSRKSFLEWPFTSSASWNIRRLTATSTFFLQREVLPFLPPMYRICTTEV